MLTPKQWREVRRPELIRLFERHVYGEAPPPRRVVVERAEAAQLKNGRVKQAALRLEGTRRVIELAVFLPPGPGPFPVIVAANKCGNQAVLPDPVLRETKAWLHPACGFFRWSRRGGQTAFWSVETLLASGYALATFHESDVELDRPDGDGVRRDLPGSWGAVAAWAWGLRRVADQLARDPDVDPARLIVWGHSRRGKAALLAGALDERFALVVPHQSGTGGMALSRGNRLESVGRITRDYPHWFADAFRGYADDPSRLPVDQDELVALVAPRPLLDTEGRLDVWSNYWSAAESLRRAEAVYRLLGAPGRAVQHRRWTWHTMDRGYWEEVVRYADRTLGRRTPPQARPNLLNSVVTPP